MSLVGAYSSDEDAIPPAEPPAKKQKVEPADAAKPKAALKKPKKEKKVAAISSTRLRQVLKEITDAKSATACVVVARREMPTQFDMRWGAPCLFQVALKSTNNTRKDWVQDKTVKELAERLRAQITADDASWNDPVHGARNKSADEVENMIVALEALRRMDLTPPEDCRPGITRILSWYSIHGFHGQKCNRLASLAWLASPIKLNNQLQPALNEIRTRATELDGNDLHLLIWAHELGLQDYKLQCKVMFRLRISAVFKTVHRAADLVDMVEHLVVLRKAAKEDEAVEQAMKSVGIEILSRWPELSHDEGARANQLYQSAGLPMQTVWATEGTRTREVGGDKQTIQIFAPVDGHEKIKGQSMDFEPIIISEICRVDRDRKMASY